MGGGGGLGEQKLEMAKGNGWIGGGGWRQEWRGMI